ncbi:endonuclease [Caulobacter zeae]|uniref:Endonuclease n=1 Tax=Caulobacter zeae TaxID=2055137 RepID=A0A2N5D8C8_9CAUL|nr:endonuclease domain-containing protein [Caulobacter zeae]PLR22321.1 endonuclease [Caulobacter zeae]
MDRIASARRLRRTQTFAETKLWEILRNGRLDGSKFRRQMPIDRYFADFACRKARLIVELDGAAHRETADYDARRTEVLEHHGFMVIRFDNEQVLMDPGGVAEAIQAALRLTV